MRDRGALTPRTIGGVLPQQKRDIRFDNYLGKERRRKSRESECRTMEKFPSVSLSQEDFQPGLNETPHVRHGEIGGVAWQLPWIISE